MNQLVPFNNMTGAMEAKFRASPGSPVAAPANGVLYRSEARKGLPASDLAILGIASDMSACGHFRIKYPLMALAEQGAGVEVRAAHPQAPVPIQSFLKARTIYLSRATTEEFRHSVQSVAALTGATVVYDLDDCVHEVSPNNPCYPYYSRKTADGKATLQSVDHFLRMADGALFSTRELQAYYAARTRFAHVLPNGLDFTLGERDWTDDGVRFDWREVAAEQGCAVDAGSLLFGWFGSGTHYDDLLELGHSVAKILMATKNTFFGIFTTAQLAGHFCIEKWQIPLHRVVYLPPVPFREYPRVLSAFDVGLAPLKNCTFNRCKSNLRLLEMGAWGVPYVASKVASYYRFHLETESRGGLIAENEAEFVSQTIHLLQEGDIRRRMGAFLKPYVREAYDVRRTMAPLAYTLRAIQESKTSVLHKPSFQAIQDAACGIPRMRSTVKGDAPCPCGSGDPYRTCRRGCPPAFGRI